MVPLYADLWRRLDQRGEPSFARYERSRPTSPTLQCELDEVQSTTIRLESVTGDHCQYLGALELQLSAPSPLQINLVTVKVAIENLHALFVPASYPHHNMGSVPARAVTLHVTPDIHFAPCARLIPLRSLDGTLCHSVPDPTIFLYLFAPTRLFRPLRGAHQHDPVADHLYGTCIRLRIPGRVHSHGAEHQHSVGRTKQAQSCADADHASHVLGGPLLPPLMTCENMQTCDPRGAAEYVQDEVANRSSTQRFQCSTVSSRSISCNTWRPSTNLSNRFANRRPSRFGLSVFFLSNDANECFMAKLSSVVFHGNPMATTLAYFTHALL